MNKLSSAIKEIFTPGTPLCALAYAALGVILATLLLTIGFWRTLFIAVFAALGALAGGIGNKRDAVRVAINRSFPPKDKPLDIEQDTQDQTNKPEESGVNTGDTSYGAFSSPRGGNAACVRKPDGWQRRGYAGRAHCLYARGRRSGVY